MKKLVFAFGAVLLTAAAPVPSWRQATPAAGRHAMVATEQRDATAVGLRILRRGGNAVDAAVAVAYALAVTYPCCGNVGGGGFMLVRMHDGRERFIDFREKAPLRANPRMYLDARGDVIPNASTRGYLAAGVPGTVMGMERAREEFGTLSRETLMQPAIDLAENGYRITPGDAAIYEKDLDAFARANGSVRAIFLRNGKLPQTGDVLRQPDLARTLRLIAKGGAPAFYRGTIAQEIVDAGYAHGGMLTMEDFSRYTIEEQTPVHCRYRGYDILTAPPPSAGGVTMCEILNIMQAYPLHAWGWGSVRSVHYVTEAERRAYADRNTYLGDPAFVSNPIAQLLSPGYAAELRRSIAADKATPSADVRPGLSPVDHENAQTTHYSIVDRWGNAVAVNYTINDGFGAGVIAPGTGFFLNDEMDDFASKPGAPNLYGLVQGVRNDIEPGKRPLSSMTPTVVTKNGKLFMVTGAEGGSLIITTVLSTIQNVVDYGMNVQAAVDAPRTHMQWLPDEMFYEPGALDEGTARELQAMGYTLSTHPPTWASAEAVTVDPVSGVRYGGSDARHPAGLAAGY
jgi:gamma-glutamyltranspeptidase/glutathione hydrolase